MTAQYLCHFTGTARAPCGDLAIAVRGPYDHRKSLWSSCDFLFQHDQQKPCVLRTIVVRPPCDARTGIVRCSYDVSTGYVFTILNFLYKQNRRGYDDHTTPKNRTISYDLRTEVARKWEFRHRTIAVSSL